MQTHYWPLFKVPRTPEEWAAFSAGAQTQAGLVNTTTHYDYVTPEYKIYDEVKPLLETGAWLDVNGEAIYATRPYDVPELKDCCGNAVCFTQTDEALYAISLREELADKLNIIGMNIPEGKKVTLLGTGEVQYENMGDNVRIYIPENYTKEKAYAFKIEK